MNIGKPISQTVPPIIPYPFGYAAMNSEITELITYKLLFKGQFLTWNKVFQTISFVYTNTFRILAENIKL